MTPRYTSTGCSKPWQSVGYKDRSSLGGALPAEPTDWFHIGMRTFCVVIGSIGIAHAFGFSILGFAL